MRILTIDIGKGTQYILVYTTEAFLENSIKLVLPSPHLFIAQQIAEIKNDLYLDGEIIGAGKLKHSLLDYINKGYKVVMEPNCARTISDDLQQVNSLGINNSEDNVDYTCYNEITLSDKNINKLLKFLLEYDLDLDYDIIPVSVLDYDYNSNMGDKVFHFEKIKDYLIELIEPYIFGHISPVLEYYSSMKSIEYSLEKEFLSLKHFIMDSKFAYIFGMVNDTIVKDLETYIIVDIGNDHTITASIVNGEIQGLFELHTSLLNSYKLENYIVKLANSQIINDEIYNYIYPGAHLNNLISNIDKVILTGFKSHLIEDSYFDYHYACPGSDDMMIGTISLIKTAEFC